MTISSLECNESIHFKSIASGTFSSNPINIQACQRNKPETGICIGPIPKSDLLECCASTSDSVAMYSAIEMSEFPNNGLILDSATPPGIISPESAELNTM
jgi:hypothetical protein